MSSEVKQLIVVVEGTAALGPYWNTIVSDYLRKIIRSFCGIDLNEENKPVSNIELSYVIFNAHGPYCGCLVQRTGWTIDVDSFLQRLSSIHFSGGGFNDVAIAEGLAEALTMFSPPSSQAQPSNEFKRHCILITASNPQSLPTPVSLPRLQTVEGNENGPGQSVRLLSDAKTVASYFPRLSVSLSVVCPRELSMIKDLYTAAKLNVKSEDLSIYMVKNKFYLVRISENFVEARTALSHFASNPMEVDTGKPPAHVPAANVAILNPQPVSVEPAPTATVKVVPSIPSATQAIPSIQTSSASPPLPACSSGGANVNLSQVLETVGVSGQQEMTSMAHSVPARVGQSPGPSNSSSRPQKTSKVASNLGVVPETRPWLIQGSHSSGPMQKKTSQSKFVKLWEGDLVAHRQGQPVFITKLEGYRSPSSSDSLAANWPPTMQILRLVSQDHMNRQYVCKTDSFLFRAMNQHVCLDQLQRKKLCAVIRLPLQTLLLCYYPENTGFIGKLFPRNPNQPQLRQQQLMAQVQQQQQQMGGEAVAQAPGRSQQDGGGEQQPTMPGAGFMG